MTRVVVLPDLSVIPERRKSQKRPMTYQVIFCGVDGVVIASDRLEGVYRPDSTIARGNDVKKIRISGDFAWAASGGEMAKIFSLHLAKTLPSKNEISDADILEIIENLRKPTLEDWKNTAAQGSDATSRVILVRGSNQSIFRINPLLHMDTDVEQTRKGRCIAGQIYNTAAFLFHRLHHTEMTVTSLATLAAYSIRRANCFDSSCIDGLDIAIYRKEEKKFHFIETDAPWNHAPKLEDALRACIAENALPIRYKT